jgi:hypothetical protein
VTSPAPDNLQRHGIDEVRETYAVERLGREDGRYRVARLRDPEGNRLALVGSTAG